MNYNRTTIDLQGEQSDFLVLFCGRGRHLIRPSGTLALATDIGATAHWADRFLSVETLTDDIPATGGRR